MDKAHLCQSTGLVGANDRNRAQSFDGLQRLAQNLVLPHNVRNNC
jgi:hypothetical protein